MANEIALTASLTAFKASVMQSAVARFVSNLLVTMTGNYWIEGMIQVATGGTAIPLGQVTQPHWSFWINHDATNYVTLFNGVSGAVFARLLPGEPAFVPLDPSSTPYAQANTAAINLEYLILSL